MKSGLLLCLTLISCQLSEVEKPTVKKIPDGKNNDPMKIDTTFWSYSYSKSHYYANGALEYDTSFLDDDFARETFAVTGKILKIGIESAEIDCYRETEYESVAGGDPLIFYFEDPTYGPNYSSWIKLTENSGLVHRSLQPIHRGCVRYNRINHALVYEAMNCSVTDSLINLDSIVQFRYYGKDSTRLSLPNATCN